MDIKSHPVYKELLNLQTVSLEISTLLDTEELDNIISKLKERQSSIDFLQKQDLNLKQFLGVNYQQKEQRINVKTELNSLVQSIIEFDKKNMDGIRVSLDNMKQSLRDLGKEKETIKNMRSITEAARKQIVDFLY